MSKQERVILIKGGQSKWYEQAIFIVNQNIPIEQMPVDFVQEAEKIIHNYITRGKYNQQKAYTAAPQPVTKENSVEKNKKKSSFSFDMGLNMVMLVGCLVMAFLLFKSMTG